jgi:hypothetical protein
MAESMLQEALSVIHGERRTSYGGARENHERIAQIWSAVLRTPVTPEQVVLCMIGVKMARICTTPDHRDSWVDIAGYVGVKDLMGAQP